MAKLDVVIKSINKSLYDGWADIVVLKTVNGQIGIMANHIPVINVLSDAWAKIKNDDQEFLFDIKNAVAEVKNNRLCILCFE